jgi:hypothetical protein
MQGLRDLADAPHFERASLHAAIAESDGAAGQPLNAEAVDLLQRCPYVVELIVEFSGVPDRLLTQSRVDVPFDIGELFMTCCHLVPIVPVCRLCSAGHALPWRGAVSSRQTGRVCAANPRHRAMVRSCASVLLCAAWC